MVIPDWTAPTAPKLEFESNRKSSVVDLRSENFARPLDRLAAAIVDVFVLLAPIYILLSAPFKRGMTASFILGSEPDLVSVVAAMAGLAIFLVVSYQSVLHYFFGATFGKMLFDIRVKPMFREQRLTFASCVVRSLLWVGECLTLGLPMFAVFANSKRRVVHDRVCDTIVVSHSQSFALAPGRWERGLVRGSFMGLSLFALMVCLFETRGMLERLKGDRTLVAMLEKDSGECEAVSQNLSGEEGEHARLEMAMSLYAAGLAERSCLEFELEHEMATQTAVGPITYLAQAFVNSDDAEVSNSYLDQVCEEAPGTVECAMSKVVTKWSEEDWTSVESLLSTANPGSGYLEVWAVRHYMKQARYSQALAYLDTMTAHKELAEFTLQQRVKALFNSYHESEANVALAQALPTLPKEEGDELSAWMCSQQLQSGCGALTKLACGNMQSGKEIGEIDFEHASVAMSKVMALECQGSSVDYLTFSESVKDEDWQVFFRAALKLQKDDTAAAFKLFSEVVQSSTSSEVLRVESLRRLAQFADSEQMASLVESWEGFENKEAWVRAGNILFDRLAQNNESELSLHVAQTLTGAEALSPQSMAKLIDLEQNAPSSAGTRRPASIHPAKGRGEK